jgi:methylase of polypeptide subunit release factors
MFVQSEKFVESHGGRINDISIYGQESNYTTWRLAMMNMAIRGIEAHIAWNEQGSFQNDAFKDLKADYILANPPFNDDDWGGKPAARGRALEIWRAADGQRQLRLGATFHPSPCTHRHGRVRSRQRQHVRHVGRRR